MGDHRRSPDTSYTSVLPPEHIEQIRQWYEEGLRAVRAEASINEQTYDYVGLTLYVPPQVQPIYAMSTCRARRFWRGAPGRPGARHGHRLRG